VIPHGAGAHVSTASSAAWALELARAVYVMQALAVRTVIRYGFMCSPAAFPAGVRHFTKKINFRSSFIYQKD
jgi:hypothetical protein